MKYFFRKDTDDASRRAKCARWGVLCASDPNEPAPSPANPPAPNP